VKDEVIKYLFDLLKPVQKSMFRKFYSNNNRKSVVHCSRRLGKTYLLCVIALITAINKSNAQIRYASVTQKAVRKMIHPIFKELHMNIPEEFRGKFNSQEGAYVYQNGSMVHVAGVNNGHSDDLRGTAADLCLVDEASFVDDLQYLVESVLMPQLLTVPDSKLIMASSSPLTPAHEFANYIQQAELNKSYYAYNIHEGGYTPELVAEFCKEAGGALTTTWRREYMNELIVDEQMSIIPEWSDKYISEYKPTRYDKFYHRYEAMDIGVRDKTVVLFGHYDFMKATLIITNEIDISGPETTTKAIADLIKSKRTVEPYRAVADNNNLLLLNDLSLHFQIEYYATNKDTLPAMVNELRLLVDAGRLQVSPNCKQTIGCLKYGVYQDDKRKMFGRSSSYGHYDALAALIYLVRNLDIQTNPIPRSLDYSENTHDPKNYESNPINQIFNIKER
jgi:hypothetical protein